MATTLSGKDKSYDLPSFLLSPTPLPLLLSHVIPVKYFGITGSVVSVENHAAIF
jgi:hypothetical protein